MKIFPNYVYAEITPEILKNEERVRSLILTNVQSKLRNGPVYCFSDFFLTTNAKLLPQVFILCYRNIGVERRRHDNAPLFLEKNYCA